MLKGKNAVVTGSTSGIGLGIARALAKDGANVLINGFGDAAEIEKERAGIEKEFGVKALYSPADMTKPAEIAAMIKTARDARSARVDILVNNAGIQHVAPIEEFPIEKWDAIIAINLSSAFHAIRAAVPGMKARSGAASSSTASAHSLVASPFKAAYVTAKHGLAGLTKTVALEVATFGITCQLHLAGLCLDAAGREADPRQMKARNMTEEQVKNDVLLAAQPTKQFVTVEQVAALALYLTSDAAASITGANSRSTAAGPRSDEHPLARASAARKTAARRAARSASTSRCRAAARTARSPGACSTSCWTTGGSRSRAFPAPRPARSTP